MTQTASRLIARFGQAATIVRPGPLVPDGAGGGVRTDGSEHAATVAVVQFDQLVRAGSGFHADDVRVLVSAEGLAVAPQQSDRIRIGATNLKIIAVSPVGPDGAVILWEVKARNG